MLLRILQFISGFALLLFSLFTAKIILSLIKSIDSKTYSIIIYCIIVICIWLCYGVTNAYMNGRISIMTALRNRIISSAE